MVERDNIKPYQKIINLILTNPVAIAITVFVLVTIIVISISFKYYESGFGKEVLIEAHGMLFDILIIGILILYLNILREKRITSQRYIDEIDDFRGWESEEAAFRIAGNIKRLNRNGYKGEINLAKCYMRTIDLTDANLAGAFLRGADLKGANLMRANFMETNLRGTDLERANLTEAKLMRAYLKRAYLKEAGLELANLEEANLWGADLEDAELEGANLVEANLENVKNLTINQLSTVKSLYKAKLDPGLKKQIKEKHPHLLEKPKKEESKPDE